ncbi:MAG: hypothetical protein H6838_01595 [Planctomycetes bacterium]|nr:hypothetical protein [Planctomycetota bacterium]MCB9884151.1 hypothetical protein [Planctomycetota bacterium]
MKLRQLLTACLMSVGAMPLLAQDNCPMEATRREPLAVFQGPAQNCGGLDWHIGGVQVAAVRDACPLFVIVTPAHDVAVRSTQRTQVEAIATVPVTKVTFECDADYFLFFHIGSSCVFGRQLNVGLVHLMVTRPCATIEPE